LAEFQSFIFGQILADFGSFGQIWADFPAFTVAESMPELGLKSSKPHNFSTVSKCYMQWLVGKLPSISIASKSFKKSPKKLHSQQPAQTSKKPFWLTLSFRG
jgi:hypothetical protein